MISGETTSCFPAAVSSRGPQLYSAVTDDVVSTSLETSSSSLESTHPNSLLYPLSLLKEKVHHLQNLASVFISPDPTRPAESTAMAAATMATVVQEIIVTASSMMFTCQQMTLASHPDQAPVPAPAINNTNCGGGATASTTEMDDQECVEIFRKEQPQDFYSGETLDWFGDEYATSNTNDNNTHKRTINWSSNGPVEVVKKSEENISSESSYDIIELKASDLLAKYTHYCHVCGKGFKRDANLRMHMRAHGDEYKTSAALSNPAKGGAGGGGERKGERIKYSCPEEGCRWNRKHAKFQPLKSMICVKNHYKRSHCPKMYVCKRCNRKQFSVLSDLRTHEKHCGDQRWLCSCGTTFSRKDKLLGHVALFVGHAPAVGSLVKVGKIDRNDHVVQI